MTLSNPQSVFGCRDTMGVLQVALGREPADLVIVNACLVNVYSGEILDHMAVAVKGQWIVRVGPDVQDVIGDQTHVIDAAGRTLIPGLIDGHTHLTWLYNPSEFAVHAMVGGTTTVVTETMEAYPVMGIDGVMAFLEACANQPIKIVATAPAMGAISSTVRGIAGDDLSRLLARDDVIGLGESYWQNVLQHPDAMIPAFEATLACRKTIEGHSAGARGKKLNAYIAAGVTSCHEPIRAAEVLERLRLGMYVMIREGSIRRDLEAIAAIRDKGVDSRRLILVSDGLQPDDLCTKGYMEAIVQKAVDLGFEPMTAIQMATLNVADHFGLDGMIGGIAPGRQADMVLIPDPRTIVAETVVSRGRIVAQNGRPLVAPRCHRYPRFCRESIRLDADCTGADFTIQAKITAGPCTVRIIDLVTDLVTRELHRQWPVVDAEINPDVDADVIKVAAVDRTHFPGKVFTGLLRGFGLLSGAMASSASWDTSDIVVAGSDPNDMALAVNRIRALGGGAVVCNGGVVIAEMPLPIMGLQSEVAVPELASQLAAVKQAAKALGVAHPDPLLTLVTLTGAAIPYLRICEQGLVNLKDGLTRGLFVES